jgi:predicted nucleic acid-binding protein
LTEAFFDPSALVKLVMVEPGSEAARTAWRNTGRPHCSGLAFVEGHSALAAARRNGRLDDRGHHEARAGLLAVLAKFEVVEVDQPLVDLAGDLAERHALRGDDAVQLAAAITVGAELFVSSDAEQLRTAHAESIATLDPGGSAP